jgi:hypothetical protein
MVAEKKAAETNEWAGATRTSLTWRKAASRQRFDMAVANLESSVAPAVPVPHSYDEQVHSSPGTRPHLPDHAKEQVMGVSEILAKLGIGKVASVKAATFVHTPMNAESADMSLAQNA